MKMIPNDELRVVLSVITRDDKPIELLDMRDMEDVFNKFGDDWFVVDGDLELVKPNENRKEVMRIYGQNIKPNKPS